LTTPASRSSSISGRGVTRLGEDFAGVLAEHRRRPADGGWLRGQLERGAQHLERPGHRVLDLRHHLARGNRTARLSWDCVG
jgi:hypothetical protein